MSDSLDDPLDPLYKTRDDERRVFGVYWQGPVKFDHGVETLVAVYPPATQSSKSKEVQLFCTACPARFYSIRVHDVSAASEDSHLSYAMITGSGHEMAFLAHSVAEAISRGMFGLVSTLSNQAR